jgi:hypothetical protein
LVEALQESLVGLHAVAGLEDLGRLFKQEGSHLPFGEAAAEVEEGAVFLTVSAATIGAAAFEKALQKGGVNRILREGEGAQQTRFAVTQGEGGEVYELRLTHNMSKIARPALKASENENAC